MITGSYTPQCVFVQWQETSVETLIAGRKYFVYLKYGKSRMAGTVLCVKFAQLRLRPQKGQAAAYLFKRVLKSCMLVLYSTYERGRYCI